MADSLCHVLGGAMTACGMLGSITRMFVRFTHKLASTVAATVASGLFLNLATATSIFRLF